MPDLSDMMPGAPLPDSDPDGTSRLVENSVVVPIDPEQLRARLLALFFPQRKPHDRYARLENDVLESIECAKAKFGGVNVLINPAGDVGYENIYDFKNKKPHSADLYRCAFETNLRGLFNVMRLRICSIAKDEPDTSQQRGVIINLSSTMAYEPPPGLLAYGATKSAVSGLTIPLATGLALQGIPVITIYPGYIDNPITDVKFVTINVLGQTISSLGQSSCRANYEFIIL